MDSSREYSWAQLTSRIPVCLHLDGNPVAPIGVDVKGNGVTYAYPSGIRAIGTRTVGPNTVEWSWRLENAASAPSACVTGFFPLYLVLPCKGRHAPVLHGSRGGLDDANFPPESWTQWNRSVVSEGLPWVVFRASSSGGRSSNRDLPFFVLEEADRRGGLFTGLGWSGDWHLQMERKAEQVTVQAGMTNLALCLEPGESLLQPSVLLGRYRGDAADGQRALRNHLRDHVQPPLGDQPARPVSFWDHYYGDRGAFFEKDALAELPYVAEAGFEYFILSGGWNGGGEDSNFMSLLPHVGTWTPGRNKFPNGLAPIKALADRHRIKLGIWFDIERAHRDSQVAREHPEFVFPDWEGLGCRLLRLQHDQVRDWMIETLSREIRRIDARWLFIDFNTDPAEGWAKQDSAKRRGATECRYIENLYKVFDVMLGRFPEMLIENCASGGRRIDLETIRRSHTDWISDHSTSEAVIRYHLHGACRWLPCNHLNTAMAHAFLEPNRPVNWREPLPASAYLSHFGGNFSVSDRLAPLTSAGRAALRRYMDIFKKTSACFAGDCYPLGDQAATLTGPSGLAAVDPATGQQAVVLFGVLPEAAAEFVPDGFRSLVAKAPECGDGGTDQFTSACLWHG